MGSRLKFKPRETAPKKAKQRQERGQPEIEKSKSIWAKVIGEVNGEWAERSSIAKTRLESQRGNGRREQYAGKRKGGVKGGETGGDVPTSLLPTTSRVQRLANSEKSNAFRGSSERGGGLPFC